MQEIWHLVFLGQRLRYDTLVPAGKEVVEVSGLGVVAEALMVAGSPEGLLGFDTTDTSLIDLKELIRLGFDFTGLDCRFGKAGHGHAAGAEFRV